MLQRWKKLAAGGLALVALLAAAFAVQPLRADGPPGADAERRGGNAAALGQWEEAASQGNSDAMFRLAQAYRFGRGVPVDLDRAEALYARSAAAGHPQAADAYGLMLFEAGRREAAIPYLRHAAGRGDPRAQYLLGIAYFNGDYVEVDWPRAYALMTLANAAGLPQATAALAEMDRVLPLAQRRRAAGLADRMRAEAEAPRGTRVASAFQAPATPAGSEDRALPAGSPAPVASHGDWRVQLGAFSIVANAEALWSRLSDRPELQGAQRLLVPTGRVTRLLAGGYASRAAADAACRSLRMTGTDCLVTAR